MSQFEQYASQLQSRLRKRSTKITENELWESGYRHLGRKQQLQDTKEYLKELRSAQTLDKKLLSVVQEIAYQNKLNAVYFEEFSGAALEAANEFEKLLDDGKLSGMVRGSYMDTP